MAMFGYAQSTNTNSPCNFLLGWNRAHMHGMGDLVPPSCNIVHSNIQKLCPQI
jgi:hypothetical protein